MTASALQALEPTIAAVSGKLSVYCGPLDGPPAYTREPDATHYAASTMKVAVLAALYRAADAGRLDLDAELPVHNDFPSAAPGAARFGCAPDYDSDTEVWARIGGTASLRWLARRMIVVSGNLATNICLSAVGFAAVAEVWRLAGARHSAVGRCIEDSSAADAGITNLVTARDLATLLAAIVRGASVSGPTAPAASCAEMRDVLLAQERGEDLAAGLPPETPIAHKNGWIFGIRHGAGVVFPGDCAPYVLVVCTTTPLAQGSGRDDAACRLLSAVAAASWADRHRLSPERPGAS